MFIEKIDVKFIINDLESYGFLIGFCMSMDPSKYTSSYMSKKSLQYLKASNNGKNPVRVKVKMNVNEFEMFLVTAMKMQIRILCDDVFILEYLRAA